MPLYQSGADIRKTLELHAKPEQLDTELAVTAEVKDEIGHVLEPETSTTPKHGLPDHNQYN